MARMAQTAGRLFARQGYHGTSTHEIARLAGIAENTLFRNFDSKENLFWASLRLNLAGWSPRQDLLDAVDVDADPEVVLPRFVAQIVDATILNPELLRLMAVAFFERRSKAMEVCGEAFSPLLAARVEESRGEGLAPELIAGAIVTMSWMHPVLSEFINGAQIRSSNQRDTTRALSNFWIAVLARPERRNAAVKEQQRENTSSP